MQLVHMSQSTDNSCAGSSPPPARTVTRPRRRPGPAAPLCRATWASGQPGLPTGRPSVVYHSISVRLFYNLYCSSRLYKIKTFFLAARRLNSFAHVKECPLPTSREDSLRKESKTLMIASIYFNTVLNLIFGVLVSGLCAII